MKSTMQPSLIIEKKCVAIGKKGNKLILKGITEEGRLNMTHSGSMNKILKRVMLLLIICLR